MKLHWADDDVVVIVLANTVSTVLAVPWSSGNRILVAVIYVNTVIIPNKCMSRTTVGAYRGILPCMGIIANDATVLVL